MDNYGIVTAGTQTLTEGNWFVEEGRVNLAAPLVVEGDVTLHLAEGAVLNAAKGIVVSKGNSLTVLGVGDILAQGEVLAAGIGGANGQDAGEIVLKTSGMVTVTVVDPTLATDAQMTLEDTDPPAGAAFYKVGVEKQ